MEGSYLVRLLSSSLPVTGVSDYTERKGTPRGAWGGGWCSKRVSGSLGDEKAEPGRFRDQLVAGRSVPLTRLTAWA